MSADLKHTPGDWRMGRTSTRESALVGPSGSVIAYAAWDGGSGCHLAIPNEADERLIVAAPELLEALTDAMEALAMCRPQTGHGARCQSDAMLKARAAIAKAGA
ncbi:hypothetical protein [Sphingobium sp. WCS2017Hpa-17]|uniref:hypothetical protein n=1 Tax=Sphingobium sp. WCS2017Hpa-17 TaxID=3073638 RepID=UPI0028892ED0|nr:hypothetical protein [Sphingobium sp. WCS2017Hpa-17]